MKVFVVVIADQMEALVFKNEDDAKDTLQEYQNNDYPQAYMAEAELQ